MKTVLAFLALLASAQAFMPVNQAAGRLFIPFSLLLLPKSITMGRLFTIEISWR